VFSGKEGAVSAADDLEAETQVFAQRQFSSHPDSKPSDGTRQRWPSPAGQWHHLRFTAASVETCVAPSPHAFRSVGQVAAGEFADGES